MLSKIVHVDDKGNSVIRPYHYPTSAEINLLVERKRRENERRQIIDSNPDDPVRAAKEEAHRILKEAQERLKEAELEAAVLKGRLEKEVRDRLGREFQQKLNDEMGVVRARFQESIHEIALLKEQMSVAMEKDMLTLVFTITRKIMGDEVRTDPDTVLRMLRKGFEQLKTASRYEIHVHPDDYQWMTSQPGEIKGVNLESGSFNLVQDSGVEKGGCRIVSDSGEISTEPSRQLEVIIKELSHGK